MCISAFYIRLCFVFTDVEASRRGGPIASSQQPASARREHTICSESAVSPASLPGDNYSNKLRSTSQNGVLFTSMPKLGSPAEVEFKDTTKTPSYLKLSCAVSGYGRYSQYSSYKSIEKRSPYSSCSSLLSDHRSVTDMPVTRVSSPMRRTSATSSNLELGLICPQPLVYDNGLDSHGASENGQNVLPDDHYPTGDRQQVSQSQKMATRPSPCYLRFRKLTFSFQKRIHNIASLCIELPQNSFNAKFVLNTCYIWTAWVCLCSKLTGALVYLDHW